MCCLELQRGQVRKEKQIEVTNRKQTTKDDNNEMPVQTEGQQEKKVR